MMLQACDQNMKLEVAVNAWSPILLHCDRTLQCITLLLRDFEGVLVRAILRVAKSYLCYDPELTCKTSFHTGLNRSH